VLGDTAERVRRTSGFHLDASHVALSGLCKDCASTAHS
jgi:Fe2+ or Zn2+ uptake regulation protein